jgi:hypothetical protein
MLDSQIDMDAYNKGEDAARYLRVIFFYRWKHGGDVGLPKKVRITARTTIVEIEQMWPEIAKEWKLDLSKDEYEFRYIQIDWDPKKAEM